MLKKFLTTILIAAISTTVQAKSNNVNTLKLNLHDIQAWEIAPQPGGLPFWAIGLMTQENQTLIINVNKYRSSNPKLMSDPIIFDCNGVPTLLNPGTSTVCTVTADPSHVSGVDWGVPDRYQHNGSNGYIIRVE